MRTIFHGLVLGAVLASLSAGLRAETSQSAYATAMARERDLRSSGRGYTLKQLRSVIEGYESLVRRFPRSGYSDNALWQATGLALEAYQKYGQISDRATGLRLLDTLVKGYPSSSLAKTARDRVRQFQSAVRVASAPVRAQPAPTAALIRTASSTPSRRELLADPEALPLTFDAAEGTAPAAAPDSARVYIRAVTRIVLPDIVRVTVQLDTEVPHHVEEIFNPRRLFFDFKGVQAVPELVDASLTYAGDAVREIRLGRHARNTTRLVLDLERVGRYSIFTLYNPYRVVIDCERLGRDILSAALAAPPPPVPLEHGPPALGRVEEDPADSDVESPGAEPLVAATSGRTPAPAPAAPPPAAKAPVISSTPAAGPLAIPTPPSANASGKFSLARQLGLGISRIVIDPGHGGHDPGAHGSRITEAGLVLDVAMRLETLLLNQPGIEVVMTRRSDVYVALEERTAIANREHADLFLSIHANASRNAQAGGVETYFLNFASSPEAEEVAARENAASSRGMRNLPDIVQAIALNNKLDESREFAEVVQEAMLQRLRSQNRDLKDLGVKRAPFVVLIGASMPSVLAEISFLTNKVEGPLLGTTKYRQRIAEALLDAVLKYRRSLKGATTASIQ